MPLTENCKTKQRNLCISHPFPSSLLFQTANPLSPYLAVSSVPPGFPKNPTTGTGESNRFGPFHAEFSHRGDLLRVLDHGAAIKPGMQSRHLAKMPSQSWRRPDALLSQPTKSIETTPSCTLPPGIHIKRVIVQVPDLQCPLQIHSSPFCLQELRGIAFSQLSSPSTTALSLIASVCSTMPPSHTYAQQ